MMTPAAVGMTTADAVDAAWVPVRFVREAKRCDFCGARIMKGSPGARTGDRGTRAWWNKLLNIWECLECRSDGWVVAPKADSTGT